MACKQHRPILFFLDLLGLDFIMFNVLFFFIRLLDDLCERNTLTQFGHRRLCKQFVLAVEPERLNDLLPFFELVLDVQDFVPESTLVFYVHDHEPADDHDVADYEESGDAQEEVADILAGERGFGGIVEDLH